ncbi:MAG TPA: hypothetical protein VK013_18065 [Myxococcaceae bacterium]|nr:hypothetical protein [Myxococcaceae bacterium]
MEGATERTGPGVLTCEDELQFVPRIEERTARPDQQFEPLSAFQWPVVAQGQR